MTTGWARCAAPVIRLPITTLGETEAVLMEDWPVWRVGGGPWPEPLVVPAGTRTDGASIPRLLWRVCGHPLQAPRVYAALLHDWLYSADCPVDVPRETADAWYRALLMHFGVPWWRAATEYAALRLFGAGRYRKERKER